MRIFVALPLPPDVADDLAAAAGGLPGARWVAAENLHITLRFIGEADGGELDEIVAALADVEAPAFSLCLAGLGQFGRGRHLRAVWAGVEPEAPVAFLAAKVGAALVRAGLDAEGRKFTPHVTLARLKHASEGRVADWMETHDGLRTRTFEADRFVLYRSHLTKDGAHYEPLVDFPLRTD